VTMKRITGESQFAKPSNQAKQVLTLPESEGTSESSDRAASGRPDLLMLLGLTDHAEQVETARRERRSQKRAKVKLSARICPEDVTAGTCWEVIATVNATRQSLYFMTNSDWCHVGMRLRVTFPYDASRDKLSDLGELGEVTRTERLPGGRVGVAVVLRKAAQSGVASSAKTPAAEAAVSERRAITRHPFVAEAVVIDSHSQSRLRARCSDLSLQGCYVDTMNPFSIGTVTTVELRTAQGVFEAIACVNSSHIGMGMGLCFQSLTPEQTALLVDWLSVEPNARICVSNTTGSAKQNDTPDRILAKNLVRDLIAKGVLTQADIAEILFGTRII
jgi:hypothetical protein